MIRVTAAIKLAHAKTKSHRVLMWLSIIVASLLFAVAVVATTVSNGGLNSLDKFIHESDGDKFRLIVGPTTPLFNQYYNNLSLGTIQEMRAFEAQYNANETAKYKAIGEKYTIDPNGSILTPDSFADNTVAPELRYQANFASPIFQAFLEHKKQEWMKNATNKTSELIKTARANGANQIYDSLASADEQFFLISGATVIVDGKENLDQDKYGNNANYSAIGNSDYVAVNDRLLSKIIKLNDAKSLTGIPVVVSAQSFAETFGKGLNIATKQPDKLVDKQKWLKQINAKAIGYNYQVCYRNSVEKSRLSQIASDYADAVNRKNDKTYVAPTLQYNYPTTPCGDITVKLDKRTVEEKAVQAKDDERNRKLGQTVDPYHELVTFQIVGVYDVNSQKDGDNNFTKQLSKALSAHTFISTDWALIPTNLYDQINDNLKPKHLPDSSTTYTGPVIVSDDFRQIVIEFPTEAKMKAFTDKYACLSDAEFGATNVDSNNSCKKPYMATVYGMNSTAIADAVKNIRRFIVTGLLIIAATALIIIWFTISRIIGGSRQETAIYRALGAKRRDAAAIYLFYSFGLAIRITIVALILGLLASYIINYYYSGIVTSWLAAVFNLAETKLHADLFQPDMLALAVIGGLIVGSSLIASIQPIIANVLRPPIRDIRDE